MHRVFFSRFRFFLSLLVRLTETAASTLPHEQVGHKNSKHCQTLTMDLPGLPNHMHVVCSYYCTKSEHSPFRNQAHSGTPRSRHKTTSKACHG